MVTRPRPSAPSVWTRLRVGLDRGDGTRLADYSRRINISPAQFRVGIPNYATDLPGRQQVDLVKMEKGGLGGAFLIVYVGQSTDLTPASFARANAQALEKFAAVHRLVESIAPTRAALALTAADARRIHKDGKKVIFIGIENGFSHRHRHHQRRQVLRPRRPLHVVGAQRALPALRFQHR